MNHNLQFFAFGLILLVVSAGTEELLPKFLGVGFPILLTSVQALAVRRGLPMVLVLSALAGALEDAASSLPPLTSVSYFILVALLARLLGLPRLLAVLTYPCYQLWLALWTVGSGPGVFSRLLLSLPIGGLTALVVGTVVAWVGGKGGVDERD